MLVDTHDNWSAANPILLDGELALERLPVTSFNRGNFAIKIGDGVTHWNDLPYTTLQSEGNTTVLHITRADYDAITVYDSETEYIVLETNGTVTVYYGTEAMTENIICDNATTTQPSSFSPNTYCEYRYTGFTVTSSVTLNIAENSLADCGYCSILVFETDFSASTTAGDFVTFTGASGIVMNSSLDITAYNVVQIVLYCDGTNICAVVSGYEVGT